MRRRAARGILDIGETACTIGTPRYRESSNSKLIPRRMIGKIIIAISKRQESRQEYGKSRNRYVLRCATNCVKLQTKVTKVSLSTLHTTRYYVKHSIQLLSRHYFLNFKSRSDAIIYRVERGTLGSRYAISKSYLHLKSLVCNF